MKALSALTMLSLMLIACDKPSLSADKDLAALQERFHGKYKVLSATSSEAIDVNMDGTVTTDMLGEIPDLPNADVEIRIYAINNSLFMQFWPQQSFPSRIPPVAYNSNLVIYYVKQGIDRLFTFTTDLKHLNLKPDSAPLPDSIYFPFPESVTIEDGDRIKVVSPKQLFTRDGWKKVEITTLYQRYTKKT